MKYHEYTLEGNPGAGKSTILINLKPELERSGLKVNVVAPFRVVKDALKKDRDGEDPLYDIWQSKKIADAHMALELLRETVEQSRNQILNGACDGNTILLFDRGWLTLLRALEDMGETSDTIEEEKRFWHTHGNVPDTFFISTPPRVSVEANAVRNLRANWRFNDDVLQDDYERRNALILKHQDRVIEAFRVHQLDQDRHPFVSRIQEYIQTKACSESLRST